MNQASCSSTFAQYERFVLDGFFGRTSQERSQAKVGRLSDNSCPKWTNSGTAWHGGYLMRSSSEWPSDAAVSFLSDVLEPAPPVEVLAEPESLRGDYPSSREKREALAAAARRGASSAGFKFHQWAGAGGIGLEAELSPTYTANTNSNGLASTGCLNPEDPQSKRIFTTDSCGPTLSSGTGEGMNIQPSVAIPINEMVATRCNKLGRGTGFGVGKDGDPANTITCNHPHAVGTEPIAMADMIIRRLTPLECERLQGFPDNHTRIPYRGKPADECPDGPRYKAIGNSMAVPVMRWIGERIAMADKEEPIEGNTKFERA